MEQQRPSAEKSFPQKRFDKEHIGIIEQYGKDLPAPHPELKNVVVIPALAELDNDNFWRLLRSAATQIGTKQNEVEYLVVINNSDQAVKFAGPCGNYVTDDRNLYYIRHEGFSKHTLVTRFIENQRHLAVLNTLSRVTALCAHMEPGADMDEQIKIGLRQLNNIVELSDHEQHIFSNAVREHVAIYGIDCSSEQRAFVMTENLNPIGNARNIGGHIAYERLQSLQRTENGWIDFIDGDCFLPHNYWREINAFIAHLNPDVILKPMISQTPEIPKNISEKSTNLDNEFIGLMNYLSTFFQHFRKSYLTGLAPVRQRENIICVGGPEITVRASKFRDINGYQQEGGNEDFAFAAMLIRSNKTNRVGFIPTTNVYVSDRDREGSTDGIGRGSLRGDGKDGIKNVRAKLTIGCSSTSKEILQLNHDMEWHRFSDSDIYKKLRRKYFIQENIRRRFFIQHSQKIIRLICQAYDQNNEGHPSVEQIVKEIGENNKATKREIDFLTSNSVLIESILAVIGYIRSGRDRNKTVQPNEHISPDKIITFFNAFLPEYFSPPLDHEPDYDRIYQLHDKDIPGTIRDYIHIAQAYYAALAIRFNANNLPQEDGLPQSAPLQTANIFQYGDKDDKRTHIHDHPLRTPYTTIFNLDDLIGTISKNEIKNFVKDQLG